MIHLIVWSLFISLGIVYIGWALKETLKFFIKNKLITGLCVDKPNFLVLIIRAILTLLFFVIYWFCSMVIVPLAVVKTLVQYSKGELK